MSDHLTDTGPVVSLDLAGFDEVTHGRLANQIRQLCPELTILEVDDRTLREIDRANIQLAAGIISAVCAVIGTTLTITSAAPKQRPTAMMIEEVVSEIEKQCGVELARDLKTKVIRCSMRKSGTSTVAVTGGQYDYEFTVHHSKQIHIRGEPVSKGNMPHRRK